MVAVSRTCSQASSAADQTAPRARNDRLRAAVADTAFDVGAAAAGKLEHVDVQAARSEVAGSHAQARRPAS
jgi:hypothetical protein